MRAFAAAVAAAFVAFGAAGDARAGGGNYVFDGGTREHRATVRRALEASAFPWAVVPQRVVIAIRRDIPTSYAVPGRIVLDANLLEAGIFSWGVVQHEYAHQVDFLALADHHRVTLTRALGARAWRAPSYEPHDAHGAERFASTLAWAYWPSPRNAMRPRWPGDEAAAVPAPVFRGLMTTLLGVPLAPPFR